MKRLVLAVLTLFSLSAFAVGIGNDNPGTTSIGAPITNVNTNLNSVSNRIDNDVRASAAAFVAAGAEAKQSQMSYSGGNTLGATTGYISNNSPITVESKLQAPAFGLGNVYPTAPCMGSSQVGGSGVGFSFGVGTSWTDHECGKRETARSFNSMGMKEDALAVLCSSEYAAVAPSCKAKEQAK